MDKEEIIRRLKKISEHAVHVTGEPPFVMSLDDGIALDEAVRLLEEKKAVKPEHHFARHSAKPYGMEFWYTCGSCGTEIRESDKFCHECGKAVKW